MMKFRIHFTWPDGSQDYVDVEGETVDEVRTLADQAVSSRGGTYSWSEELSAASTTSPTESTTRTFCHGRGGTRALVKNHDPSR